MNVLGNRNKEKTYLRNKKAKIPELKAKSILPNVVNVILAFIRRPPKSSKIV